MENKEVIERLETLAASKTIIRENKEALKEAVEAVKERVRMECVISKLQDEMVRGIHIADRYGESKSIMAYLVGINFAIEHMLGEDAQSSLPTDEEIRKMVWYG